MASKKINEEIEIKTVSEEPAVNTEAPTVKKATKQEAAQSKGGFCMYIGPSIPGVIQSGTVYAGSKQDAMKQLTGVIEKYPLVDKLVVSGETLPADRIKVKTPGNYLYNMYQRLASGEGGK